MMHIRKCSRKGVSLVFLAALCVAAAVFPAVAVACCGLQLPHMIAAALCALAGLNEATASWRN